MKGGAEPPFMFDRPPQRRFRRSRKREARRQSRRAGALSPPSCLIAPPQRTLSAEPKARGPAAKPPGGGAEPPFLFDFPAAAEETRRQQRQRIGDRPEAASAEFGLNFTEVKKMLPFSTRNSTNCCRKENNLEIRLQSWERVDIMGLTRWGHPAGLIPCG